MSIWNDSWIPAPRPGSALPKLQNEFPNPLLNMDNLINLVDHT